jgi:uncharacterized protein YecT (DUF1311 family)
MIPRSGWHLTLCAEGLWRRVRREANRIPENGDGYTVTNTFGDRTGYTIPEIFKLTLWHLLLVVFVVIPYVEVKAASFDCDKAKSAVEKMICANAELSKLDEEMAGVYKTTLAGSTTGTIKNIQKEWLKARNQCKDVACLKSSYGQQITALRQSTPIISGSPTQALDLSDTAMISPTNCPEPKIDWRNYEWTLIVGSGRTSCEEMLAYLKSRPWDQPPPVCAEERLPPNGNWTRPEWNEVSAELKARLIVGVPKEKEDYFQPLLAKRDLMMAHNDITGDGIPENLLALVDKGWIARCRISPYCNSLDDGEREGFITLSGSMTYELLPLNAEGTSIDWQHKCLKSEKSLLNDYLDRGELIYYKKRPYWLSTIFWSQKITDNYTNYKNNPNDPYARTFELAPLEYDRLDDKSSVGKTLSTSFDNFGLLTRDKFATCYFGYFHRNNLIQNPPTKRR